MSPFFEIFVSDSWNKIKQAPSVRADFKNVILTTVKRKPKSFGLKKLMFRVFFGYALFLSRTAFWLHLSQSQFTKIWTRLKKKKNSILEETVNTFDVFNDKMYSLP